MFLKGIGASPGIAMGRALLIMDEKPVIERKIVLNKEEEINRLIESVELAKHEMHELKNKAILELPYDEAEVIIEHLNIIDNSDLIESAKQKIESESVNAEYALHQAKEMYVSMLESVGGAYSFDRANDVLGLTDRLVKHLMGIQVLDAIDISLINDNIIVVSDKIDINDVNIINLESVVGALTNTGGRASFSAIISRNNEKAAVVGLNNITDLVKNKDYIIVDGISGYVYINPDEEIKRKYTELKNKYVSEKERLKNLKGKESITLDEKKVNLYGNSCAKIDIENIIKNDSEGIGLYRTEFIFLNRESLPSEDYQFEIYKATLKKMKNKPIIMRTLDIGTDENLNYINLNKELNPSLGYRSIRLCLDRLDIFKTQLRALYRASVYGNLKIEFPMISCLSELLEVKSVIKEVMLELEKAGIEFNKNVEIGAVIEIPALALTTDVIIDHVDFVSVEIDDLIQFTCAVDRSNQRLDDIFDKFNPAILRLLELIFNEVYKKDKWAIVCGEPCGDVKMIPLLLSIGFDKFSMPPLSVLNIRQLVRSIKMSDLEKLKKELFSMYTSREISKSLEKFIENIQDNII